MSTIAAVAVLVSFVVVIGAIGIRSVRVVPQIAQGDANKVWIVPSEIGWALDGIGSFLGGSRPGAQLDDAILADPSLE
jgi:hypothetical protein